MPYSTLPILTLPSQQQIKELVDCFYSRVRHDELLGPVFARAIGNNWEEHLAKMSDFWSTVLLASRRYKGHPMQVHIALPRLNRDHFDRWLTLWRSTSCELLGEADAQLFISKAEFIGERLLAAIELRHDSFAGEVASQK